MEAHISYDPLWKSLIDRKMNRTQLAANTGISKSTLAKMGRDEYVSLEVICRICASLGCQVQDVMEIKNAV